ncbi:16S rRNA (cytosine(967)-C(5))-methyltransferase [Cyanobium sp. To12R1]|uniref:16S rRNA (cytosine(967)-C(5))-methyltransferase n=1 Tax=Cyanobium usitatum str. Tous TaxID=2116684 RepID=A0A2P7MZN3_9CYAN|nr:MULTISPECIES: 16S rRNA (cytosine(967)-C(5))-methyltransferase [Cyanobium]MCP9779304.1 16S rRNA (cytosine(967)-C(5))-methyltransferase [Cyanobium sp. To12R1]PSJ06688.1 16S rRNA (cytosine(967)-C(5))-methyltransferase [Cyanobium usitatum str. Tous]
MALAPPAETPAIGLAPRQLAWQVLLAVGAGAYADVALERELQRHPLEGADRALATELAYGAIRQRRLLDAWLDALGKVPAARQPPKLRWLLHLGLYQLLFSSRVPASAAVSTTVELAKRGKLGRLAPVANGLLRACGRRRAEAGPEPWDGLGPLPSDPAASYGLRHSLPAWLAELALQWPDPEAFGLACNQPPALDLRLNLLRTTPAGALEAFTAAGIEAAPLPDLPGGLTLLGRSGELRALPGYADGHWCVQDRAAQAVGLLLDPQPGERILDACAAPGGKSTHLAELMGNEGEVWAVDRSEGRLRRVGVNAARLGLQCIHTLAADATALAAEKPEWLGWFDRILLDAPCSGLGTLARHADARWRISPESITELVPLQRALLESLLPLLKPGGQLVYATCTVHPAENGQLLAGFLADHPGWQLQQSWQRWPAASGGDGFFAARLQS